MKKNLFKPMMPWPGEPRYQWDGGSAVVVDLATRRRGKPGNPAYFSALLEQPCRHWCHGEGATIVEAEVKAWGQHLTFEDCVHSFQRTSSVGGGMCLKCGMESDNALEDLKPCTKCGEARALFGEAMLASGQYCESCFTAALQPTDTIPETPEFDETLSGREAAGVHFQAEFAQQLWRSTLTAAKRHPRWIDGSEVDRAALLASIYNIGTKYLTEDAGRAIDILEKETGEKFKLVDRPAVFEIACQTEVMETISSVAMTFMVNNLDTATEQIKRERLVTARKTLMLAIVRYSGRILSQLRVSETEGRLPFQTPERVGRGIEALRKAFGMTEGFEY